MIVLGVDPGSRVAGYGVLETVGGRHKVLACDSIEMGSTPDFASRLCVLADRLDQIVSQFSIDFMSVEKVFLGRNVDSAFKLGHARGVCILSAGKAKIPVAEYAPRSVKKAVTGHGGAEKSQVALILQRLLGVRVGLPLDATDALALAWAHSVYLEGQSRFGLEGRLR